MSTARFCEAGDIRLVFLGAFCWRATVGGIWELGSVL
jgi:hypothetical protein